MPVANVSQKYTGSLYFVMFHVGLPGRGDEWSTEHGIQKLKEYNINGTPTHAYDAGYYLGEGAIDQEKVEFVGKRAVHRVTLTVLKRVQGGIISFEGSIKEDDGRVFNGKIAVIAVENGLQSRGLTWNSVFRSYLLRQDVNLQPKQHALFSENWVVPPDVNVDNIQLIAVAFDLDQSKGDAFAVQSVSDVDSGAVIPEFSTALSVAGAAMIATVAVLRAQRSKNGVCHRK